MYDPGKSYAEFSFGDVDARLRYDYDLTVSDLVRIHLLKGSSHWTKERGLLHKTQPYGLPMDYMGAAGDADIPETENMVFGGGSEGGLKMVSSGAMLYNKPLVSAESDGYAPEITFHCRQTPFQRCQSDYLAWFPLQI